MLAGVTNCRRSRKWGCRGRLALGFKPRRSSHTQERGPHGFGGEGEENHVALAEWGSRGSDTADGAGSLNHRLLLLFPRYGTPDWVGEKEGLFAPVGILKDFSILMKILSHYSKFV